MVTKTSQLGLRLSGEQRSVGEQAADLAGSTLSGWAVSRLTSAAWRELTTARLTALPDAASERSLAMLGAAEDPGKAQREPDWGSARTIVADMVTKAGGVSGEDIAWAESTLGAKPGFTDSWLLRDPI